MEYIGSAKSEMLLANLKTCLENASSEAALVASWIIAKNSVGEGEFELDELLREAYFEQVYYLQSNGCTLVTELGWPFPRHPACVVHDMLYDQQKGRRYCDLKFRELNAYFGRPKRGWVRWAGLRIGGWWAYRNAGRKSL